MHIVRGFTLLEMLLSVSIIGALTMISIPVYQSFQNQNDLDVAVGTLAQSLRRAQVLSRASDGDGGWGVYVATGTMTLFKGSTYAARDVAYDELWSVSGGVTVSGTQEFVFQKFSGYTSSTGSIVLTSPNNDYRTLQLTTKGVVSY